MPKTIVNFAITADSATEAQWVTGGTSGDLHQSFVFLECTQGSSEVTMSNNKPDGLRMVTFSNSNNHDVATESVKIAVRAKTIMPMIPKPNSEDSLSISLIREDDGKLKCSVSRDSRTISLKDMSSHVFDVRGSYDVSQMDKTFTVDFMQFSTWVKNTISAVGSNAEFELDSDNTDSTPTLSMRSGTSDTISQVVLVGEQNGNTDDYISIISAKALSGVKNFTKMQGGEESITGYIREGAIAFEANSEDKDEEISRVLFIVSTSLNNAPIDVNPFDSERTDILSSDDIGFIKEQVSSISSVSTTDSGKLGIDTTNNGVVKLQVTDREGTAKSVSFEYNIQDNTVNITVPLESFKIALKGFGKDDIIQISLAEDENNDKWVIMSDVKNDSEDSEEVEFISSEIAVKCIG